MLAHTGTESVLEITQIKRFSRVYNGCFSIQYNKIKYNGSLPLHLIPTHIKALYSYLLYSNHNLNNVQNIIKFTDVSVPSTNILNFYSTLRNEYFFWWPSHKSFPAFISKMKISSNIIEHIHSDHFLHNNWSDPLTLFNSSQLELGSLRFAL